jgi:tyrosine-protein kinase Etk/Wzc
MIQAESLSETQPAVSPAPEKDSSLLDVLIILARRKFFLVLFTLGAGIVAAIIALILPIRYTASTILLPPNQNSSISSLLLSQLSGGLGSLASSAGGSLGIRNPEDMYVSIFRSQTIENAMIQRFDLMKEYRAKRMSDARKKFESRSSVEAGVKDGLLRISVQDHDANRAAEMTNAYVDEFRKNSANLAITEAARRRLFFEQQLQQIKDQLTNAEEQLARTEQTSGIFQPTGQAAALLQTATALRAQITAKEVEIQGLRSFATDNNPELVIAKQELDALQSRLNQLTGDKSGNDNDLILPKGQMTQAGMEYIRKYRDVRYYETVYELLAKQFELAKLDEAREGPIVQVVDIATTPDKKSFPQRTVIVALAMIVAFTFASLWIFAKDRWQSLLQNEEHSGRTQLLRQSLAWKSVKKG